MVFAISRSKVSVQSFQDAYSETNGFYRSRTYYGYLVGMFTPFQVHRTSSGYMMDEKTRLTLAENLGDDYILCGPFSYRNQADELGSQFLSCASDWVGFSVFSVNKSGNYQSVGSVGLWDSENNNSGHIDDFWGDKPVADSVKAKQANDIWGNSPEKKSGNQNSGETDIFGNPIKKNPESNQTTPVKGQQKTPAKNVPEKKNAAVDVFGNPIKQ
jgi:hypothetical protein